jgi:GNAT superfamily N-acetyltransferase
MSADIQIRLADPDAAAIVGNLIVQLGYDITIDAARRRLVQFLDRVEHAVFVATVDERVAGVLHVCVTEALEHEPRADIRALVVDEDHRSTGIGERLVEEAERWSRNRRLSMIRVRSNVKRDRARRFYERLGYEVTKTANVFEKALR